MGCEAFGFKARIGDAPFHFKTAVSRAPVKIKFRARECEESILVERGGRGIDLGFGFSAEFSSGYYLRRQGDRSVGGFFVGGVNVGFLVERRSRRRKNRIVVESGIILLTLHAREEVLIER